MTALLAIGFPLCCLIALKLAMQSMRSEWVAVADVVYQARVSAKPVRVRRLEAPVIPGQVATGPWAEPALGC